MTVQVIDDPEKVKILVDETRQKIIYMLGRGSMSLSELARALKKTPPTIFYHMKKLASVSLIKLEKTKVVNNNLVEKYYSLAIPASCLISLRVSRPERGPVPPKKLSKTESRGTGLCVDICWDDVLAKLGLKWNDDSKKRRTSTLNKIFEKAASEADEAFKEAAQQIKIKLSSQDQQKLHHLGRAIFTLTFCKMLEKPENLNMLRNLLQSIRS